MPAVSAPASLAAPGPAAGVRVSSPADAAAQFEALLVRQMVQVMTKELFRDAGGVGAQVGLQQDALVNALTERLVAADVLRLRDVLIRQWDRDGALPEGALPERAGLRRVDPFRAFDALDAFAPLPAAPRAPGAPHGSNLFGTGAYRPFGTDHLAPAHQPYGAPAAPAYATPTAPYAVPYARPEDRSEGGRPEARPETRPETRASPPAAPRPAPARGVPTQPAPVTRDHFEILREYENKYYRED